MTILEIIEAHQYEPISDRLRVASCSCGGWQDEMPYKLRNHFEAHRAHLAEVLETHQQEREAEAWGKGVTTALNHAILNPDGITLRLEHLDGRPWENPYRAEQVRATP